VAVGVSSPDSGDYVGKCWLLIGQRRETKNNEQEDESCVLKDSSMGEGNIDKRKNWALHDGGSSIGLAALSYKNIYAKTPQYMVSQADRNGNITRNE
jgi:hypothetical protein